MIFSFFYCRLKNVLISATLAQLVEQCFRKAKVPSSILGGGSCYVMTTPTHVAANLGIFLLLMQADGLSPNYTDLVFLIGSNLIDLDHLSSRPIYDPMRNGFKTHFLHQNWKVILLVSILMLFIRPMMFLGIGLILHFFLDYLDIKRKKI